MKNLIIGLIIGIGGILLTSAYMGKGEQASENGSVAMVHVVEKATRVIIRTTIEGEESQAINIDAGYVEKEDMVNFKPVMDEIMRLKSMGYELQSSSVASISYGKKSMMRPYHTFVLVKK